MGQAAQGAAVAERGKPQMVDRLLRVLCGIHMGNDDAQRAAVERPRRHVPSPGRHPDDGGDIVVGGGDGDLRGGLEGQRAMFEIDEQPVEAAGPHHLGNFDAARQPHPDAERDLAVLQSLQRPVIHAPACAASRSKRSS